MQREVPVPVLSDPPLHLQTSPQNEFLKDSLRWNFWQFLIVYPIKHLHAVKKKRAYQNRWTKALCLYYYCVFNFIKVYFINAFHCFWCFLFWVRSLALNNHFPDLWKPLMNPSRFSFQVKNSKKKWKAFNRKQHCDKEKTPPIYEPNAVLLVLVVAW